MTEQAPAIRALRLDEVSSAVDLVVAAGLFPAEESGIVRDLLDRFATGATEDVCLVSDGGSGIVYAAPIVATDRAWDLTMLGVLPEGRRSGLATALVGAVEAELVRREQRLLIVQTSGLPTFQPARALYRRLGYREEARVRDYWEQGDDLVMVTKVLPTG